MRSRCGASGLRAPVAALLLTLALVAPHRSPASENGKHAASLAPQARYATLLRTLLGQDVASVLEPLGCPTSWKGARNNERFGELQCAGLSLPEDFPADDDRVDLHLMLDANLVFASAVSKRVADAAEAKRLVAAVGRSLQGTHTCAEASPTMLQCVGEGYYVTAGASASETDRKPTFSLLYVTEPETLAEFRDSLP